jgi:hypothetical protein
MRGLRLVPATAGTTRTVARPDVATTSKSHPRNFNQRQGCYSALIGCLPIIAPSPTMDPGGNGDRAPLSNHPTGAIPRAFGR